MIRAFSRPSSGAQWLQWQPLVLPSYRGESRAVSVVGPAGLSARPRTQHDCHHDMKVKPEAATAVIELLMMGGKTHETFWAVNKRQDSKVKNCCIWFVIDLNCTMMNELTNFKLRMNFPWKDVGTSFEFGIYLTGTCVNNMCFGAVILVTQQMQLVVDLTTTFSSTCHTICLQNL
jgi:hypothetical protein